MGSDLARFGRPHLNDHLPPFRNDVSPGPPDPLPSLAQLGCAVSPFAPPSSWTAVNHPAPQLSPRSSAHHGDDVDSTPDRAPPAASSSPQYPQPPGLQQQQQQQQQQPGIQLAQHHHQTPQADAQQHHLRPHLGRRLHRPRLAPKRPIGSSRQDSAASESPSPPVSAGRSPEAAEPSHGGAFASSPIVDSLVPSPVLGSSLGLSRHARAAIHPLTHPPPPQDPPQYSQLSPPQGQSNHQHQHNLNHNHSHPNHHPPAKPPLKARPSKPPPPPPLPLPPLLQKDPSRSASTAAPASPAPPRPLARPRRRARGARSVDGRALPGEPLPAAPPETMAQMAPPIVPPRDNPFPTSPGSTTYRSPASPVTFARPAYANAHAAANTTVSGSTTTTTSSSSSSSSSISASVNGHARPMPIRDPHPEPRAARANQSPSGQTDHASPATSSTTDELPRCLTCNEVYQPPHSMDPQTLRAAVRGIRVTDAQSLDDYNQTMENLVDMIRGHNRHPDSDLSQWWERHQHDSESTSGALARAPEAESQSEVFHSNKRRRLSDSGDGQSQKRYYAFQPTSGDTVFVTRSIAALFPGDVPREPYVPPPENNHNMWYIPSEPSRSHEKRKKRHRTGQHATRSEASPPRGEPTAKQEEEKEASGVQPRRRSAGAAPLDRILHS